MANNASRTIVFRSVSLARCFSITTATATTVKKNKEENSLYSKLSSVRFADTNISDALDGWVKEGKPVKKVDIIRHVNYLRKGKKYQLALQLHEWMDKNMNEMNDADHAIHIDLLAKAEGLASAEKYFDSLEGSAKTKKTFGALLNCCCKEKALDKALELLEKMKELNFTNALCYNNMMNLYLSVGQPEEVPLLAKEMEEKKISADSYTYNLLMNSYASIKNFNAVEQVLEKMKTENIKHDWFTYGNLATIYVNAGLLDKAHAALGKMEKMENLHDREAFHTLITLYARTSNLLGVNRAWESLKSAFPTTSNVSYLIRLLALSKLGDLDNLEKCFRQWESGCSTYDVRLSNVILESYLKRDMIEEAKLLYEKIVKSGEPNLRTLDLFTNFYIKKHEMDLALEYLEMGISKAIPERYDWFPTDETIRMFLKYFEEQYDADRAEKFCNAMKKIGRINSTVYDSLLQTNIAAVDE